MKRCATLSFPIPFLAALVSGSLITPAAWAQQAPCAAGFVEVYFEDLRQNRCISESELRTLALQRQIQNRADSAKQQQQYLRSRQQLIRREQQRLTQQPQ